MDPASKVSSYAAAGDLSAGIHWQVIKPAFPPLGKGCCVILLDTEREKIIIIIKRSISFLTLSVFITVSTDPTRSNPSHIVLREKMN